MAEQIAWIGLGNMGRGMVKNIVEKYDLKAPLTIYNRTASRSEAFAKELPADKIQVATTLEEVAKANIILSCIADDKAMLSTINDILPFCKEAKLFIDCSTIHPETSDKIGQLLSSSTPAHDFVAMPVFGAPAMADAGRLVCVPAGPKSQVDRALPFAKAVGVANIELYDQAYGAASTLKIIGNMFIINMVNQLAEGHVLAEKTGLGSGNLHKFIEMMLPGVYTAYSNRMISGDYIRKEPLFAVDLAIKDATHAQSLAQEATKNDEEVEGKRFELKNTKAALERLTDLKKSKGEKADMPAIYGQARLTAGLSFNNQSVGKK